MPYFALEINARGDIITTRGGYFDLSDREKLQKLIDIAVNSEDDIGEVPDYGCGSTSRHAHELARRFADTSAETTTLHSLIRTAGHCERGGSCGIFCHEPAAGALLVRPVARAWTSSGSSWRTPRTS